MIPFTLGNLVIIMVAWCAVVGGVTVGILACDDRRRK